MKKLLSKISVIVSCVFLFLEGAGSFLQAQKDLTIDDPDRFDAMMNAVHAGNSVKTIAAWIAMAALICWLATGITWLVSRKNTHRG